MKKKLERFGQFIYWSYLVKPIATTKVPIGTNIWNPETYS